MKKIIVIEDDLDVRTSIRELLDSAGYKVFTCEDGEQGLELIRALTPDLVLSDIMLPRMSGYDVLETIRAEGLHLLPFIFLTAKAEMTDLRHGMELGADDYLTKPFRAKELLRAIEVRFDKLEAVRHAAGSRPDAAKNPKHDNNEYVFLSTNSFSRFVHLSEIKYIEALSEYSNLVLVTGEKIVFRKVLKEWEELLPASTFVRIHRSTIINIQYVQKIEKWFKRSYKVWMKDSTTVFYISQRYASKLKDTFSLF